MKLLIIAAAGLGVVLALIVGIVAYDTYMRKASALAVHEEVESLGATKAELLKQQEKFVAIFEANQAMLATIKQTQDESCRDIGVMGRRLDVVTKQTNALMKMTPRALNEYKAEAKKTREAIQQRPTIVVPAPSHPTPGFHLFR